MLKHLQTNKDIALFSGVKDSSAVILDMACYKEKTDTHKFTDSKQININNLKLCPIIDQMVPTYTTVLKQSPNIYNNWQ